MDKLLITPVTVMALLWQPSSTPGAIHRYAKFTLFYFDVNTLINFIITGIPDTTLSHPPKIPPFLQPLAFFCRGPIQHLLSQRLAPAQTIRISNLICVLSQLYPRRKYDGFVI